MTTTALTARPTGQRSGLFGWVLAGSVAFHGTVAWVLPNVPVRPHLSPKNLVVDVVTEPPAPAAPPEPSAVPEPRAPEAPAKAEPPAIAATRSSARPTEAAPNTADTPDTARATEADDAPADFTSSLLSSDGPGVAVPGGAGGPGRGTGGRTAASAARAARPLPVAPATPAHAARRVAAGSLAKPPRAPGLDGVLERNYPVEARRAGIAGRAMLRIEVLADGRLGEVKRLSESYPGFGEACERTVRGARWEPPIDRDGSAVSTEITYTCRFEVRS